MSKENLSIRVRPIVAGKISEISMKKHRKESEVTQLLLEWVLGILSNVGGDIDDLLEIDVKSLGQPAKFVVQRRAEAREAIYERVIGTSSQKRRPVAISQKKPA